MEITIFTLFPHWFDGPLGESVIERARQRGILTVRTANFRDEATDKHRSVDDAPFGGGGGMVLRADVLAASLDKTIGPPGTANRAHVIHVSPRGARFDQQKAIQLASLPRIAIVCGHYEAIDQRLLDSRVDEEISLGDFVLTGGEIPAMAIVDAIARMLPGTLGNDSSAQKDSFMDGLLECPHYTRPEIFEGVAIPGVLTSGNHQAIESWREEESLRLTRHRRPDLYDQVALHPSQVRRLARRARPFAVFRRTADGIQVAFASSIIALQPDWQAELSTRRSEPGLPGTAWRVAEYNHLRAESDTENQQRLLADLQAAPSSPLTRNLLRALKQSGG